MKNRLSILPVVVALLYGSISCSSNGMQSEVPADPPLSDFAFVSVRNKNRVIQVVSQDGRLQKVITDVNRDSKNPTWSPDGTEIVFESSPSGGIHQIFVIRADGSGERQLTDLAAGGHHPAWSPDGQRIAFLSGVSDAKNVYLIDKNGQNQVTLATGLPVKFAPVFSKDGGRLYLITIAAPHWSLYRIDIASSQLSHVWQRQLNGFINPAWSHDRQKIAFVTVGENGASLYIVNVDGSGERLLSNAPFSNATPAWSPFDRALIFSSGSDILTVRADGLGETNLTRNSTGNYAPMWSPDGKRVVFVSIRDGNSEIYLMNTNGSTVRRITNDLNEDIQPTWSPIIVE